MLALYLHIPFCARKCAYCDFASEGLEEAGGLPAARRYVDALAVEMDVRAASAEFEGARVESVYLGGGTPTILPPEWMAEVLGRLRNRFAFEEGAEVTIEANPGTVDEPKMAALLAAGVNRFSLGVQSFSDETLRTLGRIHTAAEAQEAIASARR
ncbi:MAG TPA: radical SAM protein, partial [Anaerolineae bacterium]|nr:radical SAM protein [Anaerolineae bacterium]